MNQKKIAILLCIASLVGSLAGCGGSTTVETAEPQVTPQETTAVEQAQEATQAEETEEPATQAEETKEPSAPVEETKEPSAQAEETEEPSTQVEKTEEPSAPVEETEQPSAPVEKTEEPTTQDTVIELDVIESEVMLDTDLGLIPLSALPATSHIAMPVASGVTVYANTKINIDASNTADGYVMIKVLENTTAAHKVIVTGPSGTPYYYNLTTSGEYEVFPLSDGNGSYLIQVCKNVNGTSYSVSHSAKLTVSLTNEFAPFLLPNQYVNYSANSTIVAKAEALMAGKTTELEKIQAVYAYVVTNLTYDSQRAATVTSGYLPDLDAVLADGKGICFDYAALMTGMLRSQGIPCKLVVGYAGTAYHAWINTYSASEGWMDAVIYFDGTTWKLMDPTFASSGNSSDAIMQYIGTGSNYSAKYLY